MGKQARAKAAVAAEPLEVPIKESVGIGIMMRMQARDLAIKDLSSFLNAAVGMTPYPDEAFIGIKDDDKTKLPVALLFRRDAAAKPAKVKQPAEQPIDVPPGSADTASVPTADAAAGMEPLCP